MRLLPALSLMGLLSLVLTARGDEKQDVPKILREVEELRKSIDQDRAETRKALQGLRELIETYKIQADLKAKEAMGRIEEPKALQQALDDSRREVQKLQDLTGELRVKLAAAEAERDVLRKNSATFEKLIADLDKRESRPPMVEERRGPPLRDLRGKISGIADAGLFIVSIGAEDGVERDHVLDVYRVSDRPIYLGTITILRTYAKQSVGQYKPHGKERAEVGDEVGSQVFPNK